jgi:polyhydroxyalkanoate synthesis regulator protein
MFTPGAKPQASAQAADQSTAKDDEIAALKAQLASLQAKVDKLG